MKIWLDDIRQAPPGDWVRCFKARGAMVFLLDNGNPVTELSVDHDLGLGEPSGMDLLYAMARLGVRVPKITVHSANPAGRDNMEAFIEQMELQQ